MRFEAINYKGKANNYLKKKIIQSFLHGIPVTRIRIWYLTDNHPTEVMKIRRIWRKMTSHLKYPFLTNL